MCHVTASARLPSAPASPSARPRATAHTGEAEGRRTRGECAVLSACLYMYVAMWTGAGEPELETHARCSGGQETRATRFPRSGRVRLLLALQFIVSRERRPLERRVPTAWTGGARRRGGGRTILSPHRPPFAEPVSRQPSNIVKVHHAHWGWGRRERMWNLTKSRSEHIHG